jgi:hypothetical protein
MTTEALEAQIDILTEARDILRVRAKNATDRLPALDRLQEIASRRINGLEEAARFLDVKIRELAAARPTDTRTTTQEDTDA